MENRLYPTWQQLEEQNNPLTAGERALLKYLDNYLPKDTQWKSGDKPETYNGWLIFAQPFLNGTRPDIIIFNPQVGLVIYEVKDWNLDNYEWRKGEGLFVNDGRGSYPVKSPIDQVEQSPLDSFVVAESSVLRTNFCAEKPAHRQSAKRYTPFGNPKVNLDLY